MESIKLTSSTFTPCTIDWKVYNGVTSKVAYVIIDESDKEHPVVVCEIPKLINKHVSEPHLIDEQIMNAKLITAAPHLLESLIDLVAWCNIKDGSPDQHLRDKAIAAINKARDWSLIK